MSDTLDWNAKTIAEFRANVHFPGCDTLMFIDVVNAGWVPIYNLNLSEDVPGYMAAPATALDYPWTRFICGHLGRLATREDVAVHQAYIADIEASSKEALASVDPLPFLMHYGENFWAGGAAGSSRSSGSCRGRTCTTPWPARSPPCADAGAWPVAVLPHSRLSRGLAPAGHRELQSAARSGARPSARTVCPQATLANDIKRS